MFELRAYLESHKVMFIAEEKLIEAAYMEELQRDLCEKRSTVNEYWCRADWMEIVYTEEWGVSRWKRVSRTECMEVEYVNDSSDGVRKSVKEDWCKKVSEWKSCIIWSDVSVEMAVKCSVLSE